jgi:regulation of enolase protein 1 (concanavalin A-like superfamily)
MEQIAEVYQPMPDNIIRIHISDGSKKLEVLASYKEESHFSVSLTNSKADWLASELKSPHDINWIRLENGQVLRVIRSGEVRQLILSDIRDGQEISAAPIGVILEEVLDKVVDALDRLLTY